MLQLLKYLIFGKQCNHDWELKQSMEPFTNKAYYLYVCKKCGKFKKIKLHIISYG